MAAFTYTIGERVSLGSLTAVPIKAIWSSSTYTSGGEPITAAALGLSVIKSCTVEDSAGYDFDALISAGTAPTAGAGYRLLLKAYYTTSGTSGAVSSGAVPLNLATPAFSGTGCAAAGQVITTTDNQTMTLNQCAGMFFLYTGAGAKPPVVILSNTAVTGAQAVLTVQGVASTDAGTYKIVQGVTAHTHSTGASAASEFSGTLTASIDLLVIGY
jgi:hypothetical protein